MTDESPTQIWSPISICPERMESLIVDLYFDPFGEFFVVPLCERTGSWQDGSTSKPSFFEVKGQHANHFLATAIRKTTS